MAPINYPECSTEMGSSAFKSPKCGAQLRKPKRGFFGTLFMLQLFAIVLTMLTMSVVYATTVKQYASIPQYLKQNDEQVQLDDLYDEWLTEPSILKRRSEQVQVENLYNKWLTETGLSIPSQGWKLRVLRLYEVDCKNFDPHEASLLDHIVGDINCNEPDIPLRHIIPPPPQYLLELGFEHPELIWHNAANNSWEQINKNFIRMRGVTLDERLKEQARRAEEQAGWPRPDSASSYLKLTNPMVPSLEDSFAGKMLNGETIVKFLEVTFQKKATLKTLVSDSNCVEVIIDHLRGEVTEQRKHWEKLQVSFFIFDKNEVQEVRVVIDGQLAAGINAPSPEAYSDMEPKYSKNLQQYATMLLSNLKTFLSTGEVR